MKHVHQKIRNIFMAAIMVIAGTSYSSAQNSTAPGASKTGPAQRTPEQKATLLADSLKAALNLSSDQYQKVYAANLKFIQQKSVIKSSGADNSRMQLMQAAKTRRSEIAAALTDAQKQQWEAWKQSKKGQFKNDHPGAGKNKGGWKSGNADDDTEGM
jgi:hypothetical protein